MPQRTAYVGLFVASLVAAPARAQPGGEITSGALPPAVYSLTGSPTSQTDQSNPNISIFHPQANINQLQYNWWAYRVAGDPVQRPFGNYVKSDGFGITGTSSWPTNGNGNTASYQWTEFGPPGGVRFTANYNITLSNGPTTHDAKIDQAFQILNPNATPLTLSLFNVAAAFPDSATNGLSATGGLGGITVTDGVYDVTHTGLDASAYQVATDGTLGDLLYGGPAGDLNDTGLPVFNYSVHPYLISDAFEWTITVPPNGAANVESTLVVSSAVPEPNTLLLIGVAAGAAMGFGRRRKSTSSEIPPRAPSARPAAAGRSGSR